jgi:multifunctional beta-oxidation protein
VSHGASAQSMHHTDFCSLGRSYANAFAKLGASIVVNDITSPDDTLQEIIMNHGKAASHVGSAEDGQGIVQRAVESFGRIDILINNAGIVRDKSLLKMDDKSWEQVLAVHLRGTYNVIRAACPHMVNQGFGRIINTTSTSGIYGNFGQANYAAAVR